MKKTVIKESSNEFIGEILKHITEDSFLFSIPFFYLPQLSLKIKKKIFVFTKFLLIAI